MALLQLCTVTGSAHFSFILAVSTCIICSVMGVSAMALISAVFFHSSLFLLRCIFHTAFANEEYSSFAFLRSLSSRDPNASSLLNAPVKQTR